VAARYLEAWEHRIAFGLHMIYKAVPGSGEDEEDFGFTTNGSLLAVALAGLATIIDVMAVGVGLAFVEVNIALVAVVAYARSRWSRWGDGWPGIGYVDRKACGDRGRPGAYRCGCVDPQQPYQCSQCRCRCRDVAAVRHGDLTVSCTGAYRERG